jgi:energy-coupling factor transporter ATP-binding protein EcfA2
MIVVTARAPEPEGVLALHASAVEMDGKALLFLGPSGTGKSTMQRLLQSVARPLADDRIYLHKRRRQAWHVTDAGERLLYGPLSENEVGNLHGPPLRAIFRLHKAREPHVEPLDHLQTCRYLMEAFFEIPWQQEYTAMMKRTAFSSLAAIARRVEGYYLYFERSPRMIDVLLGCPEAPTSPIPASQIS